MSEAPFDTLGFRPHFESAFRPFAAEGLVPGRVVFASREIARVVTPLGERLARPAGRLRRDAALPVTGDWAAVRETGPGEALVEALLPRRTALARREAGRRGAPQVLAANVDVALLVQAADRLNARSLERYVALAVDGGVLPVVVVTKCDLADPDAAARAAAAAEHAAPGVAVKCVSAYSGEGLAALAATLTRGTTAALLGPSGAGKSTLANALAGAALLPSAPVRAADGRGRHTTTEREMVPLPCGAWLLDTPGLRELALLEAPGDALFPEVEGLAAECRFRDCRHEGEPGCAVLAAESSGVLDGARLAAWRKLKREAEWEAERRETTPAAAEKRRWKAITKRAREVSSARRDPRT